MPLVWLITGCSSGIGEAIALAALARGDKVIATARGSVSRLQKLKDGGAAIFELDVTKSFNAEELIQIYGTVDVLVANAGYGQFALLEEMTPDDMQKQFDVNFFGVTRFVQAFLPHLREKRSGTIAFISSVYAHAGDSPGGAYAATKHAIAGYSKTLRLEVGTFGINTICFDVGYTQTNFIANMKWEPPKIDDYASFGAMLSESMPSMIGNQPGDPERLATAVVDVVKGEGLAKGKPKPHIVPIGSDSLMTVREYAKALLRSCDVWEDVSKSVDFPGPKKGFFAQMPHYYRE